MALSFQCFSEAWPANSWCNNRDGVFLSPDMVLKSDHFPAGLVAASSLNVHISGAPNFRQLQGFPIFACGQPALFGIRSVLNWLKPNRVQWVNLREEPICYLNARPFVLRELKHPFRNMDEFKGVSAERLDAIELQLKQDIRVEASSHYDNVLVHDEQGGINSAAYSLFRNEKYPVEYSRVPVTPESVFEFADFDALINIYEESCNDKVLNLGRNLSRLNSINLKEQPQEVCFVFNCQMGRGRSTFGMILLALMMIRDGKANLPLNNLKENLEANPLNALRNGEYDIILQLVRLLPRGREAKCNVDIMIHLAGSVTNLLHDMYAAYMDRERGTDSMKFSHDLKRYFLLICFNHYLIVGDTSLFSQYMKTNSELLKLADFIDSPIIKDKIVNELINDRFGSVLNRSSILKRERFETNIDLKEKFHFMKLKNFQVFSTAQPDSVSIRAILHSLGALPNSSVKHVTWINLREEPLIFISGCPTILRNIEHPFKLLSEFRSIHMSTQKLLSLEERLKEDIVSELKRGNNRLLLHEEFALSKLRSYWLSCDESQVCTIAECYDSFVREGYNLSYHRVPLVVDSIPGASAFDDLYSIFVQPNALDNVVFNCHKGGRRSAVGMVVCCLIITHLQSVDSLSQKVSPSVTPYTDTTKTPDPNYSFTGTADETEFSGNESDEDEEIEFTTTPVNASSPKSFDLSNPKLLKRHSSIIKVNGEVIDPSVVVSPVLSQVIQPEIHEVTSRSFFGDYKSIIGLIRILKHGRVVKEQVDSMIDTCGSVFNIRESIYHARVKWETSRSKEHQKELLHDAMECLQSYAMLIVFNAYLYDVSRSKHASHSKSRPSTPASHNSVISEKVDEASVMFQASLTRKDSSLLSPYTSSSLKVPGMHDYKFRTFSEWLKFRPEITNYLDTCSKDPESSLSIDAYPSHDLDTKVFEKRLGNVLVSHSIIKSDYFSGCQNTSLPLQIEGAANCRFLSKLLLGGTAMPTFEGMMNVLDLLPRYSENISTVRWACLREEPVVYVNGRPFVLRDLSKAFENLEYTGINTKRVEAMEKQLKIDILKEAENFNGRILLHGEAADGSLLEIWEHVTDETVKTTRELYQDALTAFVMKQAEISDSHKSMKLIYSRVPITDEQAPSIKTFEWFVKNVESATAGHFFLCNCQMGRGRTTTAMVISALVTLHRENGITFELLKSSVKDVTVTSGAGYLTASESAQASLSSDHLQNLSAQYKAGEYKVIQKLIRLLENGAAVKSQVDFIIDYCSQMQNLRETIFSMKQRAERASVKSQKEINEKRAMNYLLRYFYLILFNAYLISESRANFVKPFSLWLQENPSVDYLLQSITLD